MDCEYYKDAFIVQKCILFSKIEFTVQYWQATDLVVWGPDCESGPVVLGSNPGGELKFLLWKITLAHESWLFIYYQNIINVTYVMHELCIFIHYLVSLTQVRKDT
jgi:hypothetical protein